MSWRGKLSLPQILTLGFLTIILIGTLLLSLPIASQSGTTTNYLNAFFTATSATCVTGMTVVNTALHWSIFGKIVILVLVEIGGLGFMTFAVLMFVFMRQKVDLTTQLLTQQSLNLETFANTRSVVFLVVRLSLAIQTLGVGLLFVDFYPRYGLIRGIGYSVFHSISAFCNAGFDLFDNSLVRFQNDPYLLFVLTCLIISGSLGFLVWKDILLYRKDHFLSLHTKLALTTYLGLIGISFIVYLLTEGNFGENTHLNIFQRLMDTYFMAVTPRTAGFYIYPYPKISMAGMFFTMILMLIGGTPGSTAGGIKTTTVGILLIRVWATLRGKRDATFMGRRFTNDNISRSLTLVFLVSVVLSIATLILCITESIPKHFGIEYILFDVVSAFGTTGLTLGLTPHLTFIGKLIFAALMFMGRVGIFTVMYSLLNSKRPEDAFRYPKENVMIG
ncbi:H(+)-transporting two-sector ATPase [Lentilactobacillus farraginis DSM 18382 = JCM 14108]|uniref:H(+)-transporting two-sector ATPase n=1 Tax=Lentilactobacillus farraginis DSM 18382 = JCM 14108 TaxID=1423743 RepID=X0P9G0_9LACO|nr:potassium transporter TrkG [Lentilactobacillus farraginis]KRM11124.1 H(+)-transporting two-sector ATPase [Lentilactobacillus farraginis DSM 18382 = JCM 14108]GAF35664.1 potassium uptake protein, integral membrane component, KtrB [Lentilactobacillus farraginis DSM 18382 = JCM 14108]